MRIPLCTSHTHTRTRTHTHTHTGSCSVVFTSDEGIRGGRTIPLKATVDEALEGCDCVRTVFVSKRTGANVNFTAGRDVVLEDVR